MVFSLGMLVPEGGHQNGADCPTLANPLPLEYAKRLPPMEDHLLLAASTFCFLLGFACTMFMLGTGKYRPSRFNFRAMSAGFVFQTGFLVRGHALNACPLTNLFEVLIFLSWSMVLLYFVVGHRLPALAAGAVYRAVGVHLPGIRPDRAAR